MVYLASEIGCLKGLGPGTTMIGLLISIASRPSLSLNTSGVGAGAGVALPKRKLNMWPRVDSSEMDDGSETGIQKGGKQVVREGEGAENVEMKPLPMSGHKITAKTKDSRLMWRRRVRVKVLEG